MSRARERAVFGGEKVASSHSSELLIERAIEPRDQPAAPALVKKRNYFEVCSMVRDEPDLPEWVAYCLAIGASRIHLYDNESVVPVELALQNWIKAGKVTVELVKGRRRQNRCYTKYAGQSDARWVWFGDADEYLLTHETDDVCEFLERYEKYGGIGVTWKVFGSNGHIIRPDGLVIESYTKTSDGWYDLNPGPDRTWPQYKTIAQPKFVEYFPNPHFCEYIGGKFAVNDSERRMPFHSHGPGSVRRAQINHYWCKSFEDFQRKQLRRGGASGRSRADWEWTEAEKVCNQIEDARIARFAGRVKALMAEHPILPGVRYGASSLHEICGYPRASGGID